MIYTNIELKESTHLIILAILPAIPSIIQFVHLSDHLFIHALYFTGLGLGPIESAFASINEGL